MYMHTGTRFGPIHARGSRVVMRIDREVRIARAQLKSEPRMCWRGCGRWATTVGHNPPRALHDHVPGTGCCVLLGECALCNYGEGTRIARVKRKRMTNANPSRVW